MDAHDLLARVPDAVRPGALDGIEATVQYDIERPLVHRVTGGRVTAQAGTAESPDLVIAAPDGLLLDLFRGLARPFSALMSGRLKVRGDLALARRLVDAVDRDKLPTEGD